MAYKKLHNEKWLLNHIKDNNPTWFGKGNKKFFGDIKYIACYDMATGNHRYLIQVTKKWSNDTFYCVHPITGNDTFKIHVSTLIEFTSLGDLTNWLNDADIQNNLEDK